MEQIQTVMSIGWAFLVVLAIVSGVMLFVVESFHDERNQVESKGVYDLPIVLGVAWLLAAAFIVPDNGSLSAVVVGVVVWAIAILAGLSVLSVLDAMRKPSRAHTTRRR